MIIYDIQCDRGHKFEGWFKDRQAWVEQNAGRLVSCPACNSTTVEVVPSAVAIRGNDRVKRPLAPEPRDVPAPEEALRIVNEYLRHHFEDVGDHFAKVALKIHHGEEEKRNIRGTTTLQEENELQEEGIEFIKIPLPKMDS